MKISALVSRFKPSRLLPLLAAGFLVATGTSAIAASYYVVLPAPGKTGSAANISVALSSYALPAGQVGQAYAGFDFNTVLNITGDAGYAGYGVHWSITSGALPAGLTLDPTTGKLGGTPTAGGAASFQVMASYKTKAGVQTYQVLVANITVNLAAAMLPDAQAGTAYPGFDFNQALTVDGDPDYDSSQVQYTATNLPAGMTLDGGVLSGTPTIPNAPAGGSFQVVASYKGVNGQQAYTILVKEQYLTGVTQLVLGSHHTCALMSTGGVKCWGENNYGQLGNGSTVDSSLPQDVYGLSAGVTSLSAGGSFTCALTAAGAARCWGYNSNGQLGNNTTVSSSVPVSVVGLSSGVTNIAGGNLAHTCAVVSGSVQCWGSNNYGQLGNNSKTDSAVPVPVTGIPGPVTKVSAGEYHSCALTQDGAVYCWGNGSAGQLGINSTVTTSAPSTPAFTSGIADIAMGSNFSCARTTAGAGMCWGYNLYGMVGNNSYTNSLVPVTVQGLSSGVKDVSAYGDTVCAISAAGPVCWGNNSTGSLGDGTLNDSPVPVAVRGLDAPATRIAVGAGHSCVLTTAGQVQCWGSGSHGELGNHAKAASTTPVYVVTVPPAQPK